MSAASESARPSCSEANRATHESAPDATQIAKPPRINAVPVAASSAWRAMMKAPARLGEPRSTAFISALKWKCKKAPNAIRRMPESAKNLAPDFARCATRRSSSVGLDELRVPAAAIILVLGPNDIEFSGERKRVRCNEGLGGSARAGGWLNGPQDAAQEDGGAERYGDRNNATQSEGSGEEDGEKAEYAQDFTSGLRDAHLKHEEHIENDGSTRNNDASELEALPDCRCAQALS